MRNLLIAMLLSPFLATPSWAAKANPDACPCALGSALDGSAVPTLKTTSCTYPEATQSIRFKRPKGEYIDSLSFVGGYDEACPKMQIFKMRDGKETVYECYIEVKRSVSEASPSCTLEGAGTEIFLGLSQQEARDCMALLDDMEDILLDLPDCKNP